MFSSERDAKRFFVEKVVTQALEEGAPLSAAQQWMLCYSDSDSEFDVDPDKLDAFNQEISDDEYEAKITGLIKRRYRKDVGVSRASIEVYREAFAVLDKGDHYVLALVDQALDGRLRRRSPVMRLGIAVLCLVPAIVAGVLAIGILLMALTQAESVGESFAGILFSLFVGSLAYYLIHLWRK